MNKVKPLLGKKHWWGTGRMPLPKYDKSVKSHQQAPKNKLCLYPECNKEYISYSPISKYCPFHSIIKNRFRVKKKYIDENNRIIKHHYTDVTKMVLNCNLQGCNKEYEVKLFHRLFIYPKFCPDHRSLYRRELFKRLQDERKFI